MTDFDREKIILEYLLSIQYREKNYAHFTAISDATGKHLYLTKVSCSDLLQKKLIELADNSYDLRFSILRITTLGKEALRTTYNPEWVKQQEKEKQEEKDLRNRKIDLAESSHTWTKIGTGFAIAISLIALVISIIK